MKKIFIFFNIHNWDIPLQYSLILQFTNQLQKNNLSWHATFWNEKFQRFDILEKNLYFPKNEFNQNKPETYLPLSCAGKYLFADFFFFGPLAKNITCKTNVEADILLEAHKNKFNSYLVIPQNDYNKYDANYYKNFRWGEIYDCANIAHNVLATNKENNQYKHKLLDQRHDVFKILREYHQNHWTNIIKQSIFSRGSRNLLKTKEKLLSIIEISSNNPSIHKNKKSINVLNNHPQIEHNSKTRIVFLDKESFLMSKAQFEISARNKSVIFVFIVYKDDIQKLNIELLAINYFFQHVDYFICESDNEASLISSLLIRSKIRYLCPAERILKCSNQIGLKNFIIEKEICNLVITIEKKYFPKDEKKYLCYNKSNKQSPLLSICISTFNRAKWLELNLKNLEQQINHSNKDVEIVVVDNASTDETQKIADKFKHRDNFRFIRNEKNVGILGNLSISALNTRGKYLWILGDDDLTRKDSISKIINILKASSNLELIYLNYGYSSEKNPQSINNLDIFLNSFNILQGSTPDCAAQVKSLAANTENFYTAIYSHIYRRDHGLKAYCQDTSGRTFSTMISCVPTAYYVLTRMLNSFAFWIGEQAIVVNSNVSWSDFSPMLDLEHLPECWDLAENGGCPSSQVDFRRNERMWLIELMWRQLFENDRVGNAEYLDVAKILLRISHLDEFKKRQKVFFDIYNEAYKNGHRAAKLPATWIFNNG